MARLYYPKTADAKLATGGGGGNGLDVGDTAKKIGKLIPVEIVTAYAAMVSASMAIRWTQVRFPAFVVCFIICLVLTPIYLNSVADPGKPKQNQILVGTAAFPIWAYLISGSQVIPDWYDAGLATIVALIFSLATAVIPMNR